MIKKIFIVESPNDAAFIRLLINHLHIQDADAQTINHTEIEHLHSFEGADGKEKRGKTALPEKLEMLERDLDKKYPYIEHIGIILDVDAPGPTTYGGKERSLELTVMNDCVEDKTGKPMRDFNKQWVNQYMRCFASKKQLNDAEKRLHEVISDSTDLFNLESQLLIGLKSYLTEAAT